MPWILLISFGYIEVDFVVDEWISWISCISLFRQTAARAFQLEYVFIIVLLFVCEIVIFIICTEIFTNHFVKMAK